MERDAASVRVLVVEDNDFIRELVATMLRDIGFQDIAQARDGHDALSQIETADPGLIICDISMQPMDGSRIRRNIAPASLAASRRSSGDLPDLPHRGIDHQTSLQARCRGLCGQAGAEAATRGSRHDNSRAGPVETTLKRETQRRCADR
jgi:CheY-like chemotaxis protein